MIQTKALKIRRFCHLDIGVSVIVWRNLHFVSNFVLRISNFFPEKTEFSFKH